MSIPNVNQITTDLRMMGDQQLQQYAAMHKNDPYILPMAIAESNSRKALRAAKQAQDGGQPQGKVADQAIASMNAPPPQMAPQGMPPQGMPPQGGPPMAQQRLPEQQGIGALPVKNMQNMADGGIAGYADGGEFNFAGGGDPVVMMAEGGIAHFAKDGAVNPSGFTPELQKYLLEQAKANNVDPNTLLAIVQAESGGKTKAKNDDSSAQGLFQIIDKTFKSAGGDPAKRKDPFENIRVGAKLLGDNARVLRNQLKREPSADELYTTHFLGTGTGGKLLQASADTPMADFLKSADAANADNIINSNKKMLSGKTVGEVRQTLAQKMFKALPMGAANAAPPPAAAAPVAAPAAAPVVPGDMASQIPGQRMQAPASTAEKENSYFGRLADTMGVPLQVQRDINNTLNATGGWSSPVTGAGKFVGVASKELAATPEMIAKAEQARRVADTVRLPAPAKAGLEALDAASQATRDAAIAARQARNLEQDRRAATAAEQSVRAADETANIARATEEGIAAVPRAQAMNTAKGVNAARTLSVNQFGESMLNGEPSPAPATRGINTSGDDLSKFYDLGPTEIRPPDKDLIKAAKEAVPAEDRQGFSKEDILMLSLNLLANKSPRFLNALGESGIATLQAKKEREKSAQDVEYKDIMKKYYGSLGLQAEAATKKSETETGILASGEKARTADRQKAMADITASMEAWGKSKSGMFTPEEEDAQRRKLTQLIFGGYGLPIPATMMSSGLPQGVKVTPYS